MPKTLKAPGSHKTDRIQVIIDAQTGNLDVGDLLMECVSIRRTIPDWDVERWIEFVSKVGNVPFWILCRDQDRYHMCIYGAEFIYRNATKEQMTKGLQWIRPTSNFDPKEENIAQDGRTWGGIDAGPVIGETGLAHRDTNIPVREQIEHANKTNLVLHADVGYPAHSEPPPEDPELLKWYDAEKWARKDRKDWSDKFDFQQEQRIRYCYRWLQDVGEVPKPYPTDMMELFRPRHIQLDGNKEVAERRAAITEKILDFWRKSVAKNGEGINLKSNSYRVTLAAMALEYKIEEYASNTDTTKNATLQGELRDLANIYFKAHFPVTVFGAKPGPLSTLDPGYVEYVQLCRKYKLKEGVLLHETEL